jgi:methionyl aminopeptidase
MDGDIVNVDVTVFLDGYHGDTSETFLVGNVVRFSWNILLLPTRLGSSAPSPSQDDHGRELVKVTNEALVVGIQSCGPGRPFKGIGKAIHEFIRQRGYSVSSQFTGHGIGTTFHKPPQILHDRELRSVSPSKKACFFIFKAVNDEPGVMQPGDCFTIEVRIPFGCGARLILFQPCIVQGTDPTGWVFPDGWTTSTEVRFYNITLRSKFSIT